MAGLGAMAKSVAGKVANKAMELINPAKLEKAKLYPVKKGLSMGSPVTVQFNPSEYQISRSVSLSKKRPVGRDPDINKMQAASGNFATLSLALYFDTISDLENGGLLAMIPKFDFFSSKTPDVVCKDIATLLKYNDEEHAPLKVRFVWGKLDFMGYVESSSISYTMFSSSGTPVRAKLDLKISGEETDVLQKKMQRTFSSPNRTKERMLPETDQLWMLAEQEYDDPGMWKVIADANGILNPRKMGRAAVLKVPSIK